MQLNIYPMVIIIDSLKFCVDHYDIYTLALTYYLRDYLFIVCKQNSWIHRSTRCNNRETQIWVYTQLVTGCLQNSSWCFCQLPSTKSSRICKSWRSLVCYSWKGLLILWIKTKNKLLVSRKHLIVLLTFQCFQILLVPRLSSVWDIVVGIFAQKSKLNMN